MEIRGPYDVANLYPSDKLNYIDAYFASLHKIMTVIRHLWSLTKSVPVPG